ncbi:MULTISPECIES: LacI family DNA-binding transcriptional regulator [unclassified Lysinibacillus]|uniref:LacI family DNA-binding transcriptional regulator n=1 Tax=unclassified Lysinibacillus TaxID=2636778 RepID=UPI0020117C53|nr:MULTISPECIES: LacI family DNA-binding transcriptional regulator [unclassified Lysinibacillus]MCL1696215.1 LacI family transcriptional regulator [Lysinibacillus sp. BPa_S21]MCL1700410.1 LacI family transcriptional regulator [Lysinibacillus sp. Bpr_S20]
MVSSKDVAKYAGVSQTTVSRVLNTPELVKPKTVEKVMNAIEELNYIPNDIARSLVQKKTGIITLISGPLHNPFFVDTTTAIVNYVNARGYKVNVYFGTEDNLDSIYNSVLETKADAIILSSMLYKDDLFFKLEKLGIPFIMYNRKHQENRYFVEIDNVEAGYLATNHILSLGHRDVCWIGGPHEISTFYGRYEGFRNALKDSGIEVKNVPSFFTNTSKNDIKRIFEEILMLPTRPTAICAATDAIAIEILNLCLERGFHVPNDFNVIGIDNVELSKHHSIALTTVGLESEKNLGFIAIEKLFEVMEKKSACIQQTESVKLFPRNTTCKK